MRFEIRGPPADWTDALRRHADRRLRFALSRFGQHIGVVTVDILSVVCTIGGPDKSCRIVVRLLPCGRIIVEETQKDHYGAIQQAIDRAGRAVGRALYRGGEQK